MKYFFMNAKKIVSSFCVVSAVSFNVAASNERHTEIDAESDKQIPVAKQSIEVLPPEIQAMIVEFAIADSDLQVTDYQNMRNVSKLWRYIVSVVPRAAISWKSSKQSIENIMKNPLITHLKLDLRPDLTREMRELDSAFQKSRNDLVGKIFQNKPNLQYVYVEGNFVTSAFFGTGDYLGVDLNQYSANNNIKFIQNLKEFYINGRVLGGSRQPAFFLDLLLDKSTCGFKAKKSNNKLVTFRATPV